MELEYNGGGELIESILMHVWDYHNENPSYYCCNIPLSSFKKKFWVFFHLIF
jgi:hypothetical protein